MTVEQRERERCRAAEIRERGLAAQARSDWAEASDHYLHAIVGFQSCGEQGGIRSTLQGLGQLRGVAGAAKA